jgi:hypothetical protein
VADVTGGRGSPVEVNLDFPKLNYRRAFHQSMILDGRYLFVYFGMKSEVKLNNSIEYLDLSKMNKQFQLCNVKSDVRIGSAYLFDRSLYIPNDGNLSQGVDILILGGFRGDNNQPNHADTHSTLFSLKVKMRCNVLNNGLGLTGKIIECDCYLKPLRFERIKIP